MSRTLIIFDIDGTIVKGQSQRLFLQYLMSIGLIGRVFYWKLMAWFILYKMGIVRDPQKPMEYAFSFLKGKSVAEVAAITHDFFEKVLKDSFYPEALEIIAGHRRAEGTVVLVSNAADIIVREIATYLDVSEYMCTVLETESGFYSGKVHGSMYGNQKAEAVKEFASKNNFDLKDAWAYGDHVSDKYILSEVGNPVAVNPSPKLASLARTNNWKILAFKDPAK